MSQSTTSHPYHVQYLNGLAHDFSASEAGQSLAAAASNPTLLHLLGDSALKYSGREYSISRPLFLGEQGLRTTFPDDQNRRPESQGFSDIDVFTQQTCTCGRQVTADLGAGWVGFGCRPSLGTLREYISEKTPKTNRTAQTMRTARNNYSVLWCSHPECIEKSYEEWKGGKELEWIRNITYADKSVDDLDNFHFGGIHTELFFVPSGAPTRLIPRMILPSWVASEECGYTIVPPSHSLLLQPPLIHKTGSHTWGMDLSGNQARELAQWARVWSETEERRGVVLALFHPNTILADRPATTDEKEAEPVKHHIVILTNKPRPEDDQGT